MYNFGSGVMTVTPVGVANPTPVNIGLLQEAKIDVSVTLKELFGQYKDALAIGSGTRKWSGTAKVAQSASALQVLVLSFEQIFVPVAHVPMQSRSLSQAAALSRAQIFKSLYIKLPLPSRFAMKRKFFTIWPKMSLVSAPAPTEDERM